MNFYKIMINGENLISVINGKECLVGFFTTRFVEAPDVESAKLKVVEEISKDAPQRFRFKEDIQTNSKFIIDKINVVDFSEASEIEVGYVFYEMNGYH